MNLKLLVLLVNSKIPSCIRNTDIIIIKTHGIDHTIAIYIQVTKYGENESEETIR
jgi:hypothetical protein